MGSVIFGGAFLGGEDVGFVVSFDFFCLVLVCLLAIVESAGAGCWIARDTSVSIVAAAASSNAAASIFCIGRPATSHSGRKSKVGGRRSPQTSSSQHRILLRRRWLASSPCGRKGSRRHATTPNGRGWIDVLWHINKKQCPSPSITNPSKTSVHISVVAVRR